jgi:hypothetical protein
MRRRRFVPSNKSLVIPVPKPSDFVNNIVRCSRRPQNSKRCNFLQQRRTLWRFWIPNRCLAGFISEARHNAVYAPSVKYGIGIIFLAVGGSVHKIVVNQWFAPALHWTRIFGPM